MDQNECMLALERLMDEFFNHSTSNERKHGIEQELQAFKATPEALALCSHFLTHSSNQYVIMLSLSVLESVIQKSGKIYEEVRDGIRMILHNFLFTSGIHAPHYLREKYAKLFVDIAKQDWPHRYPQFIDHIVQLLNIAENRALIGLIILRTVSEEFTNESSVPDESRRNELVRELQACIPLFLSILTVILESLDDKPRHTATATPPPSPTLNCVGMEPTGSGFVASLDSFAPDHRTLHREVLRTLQHLFTWVSISSITPRLIKCIFSIMNFSSYSQEDMNLSMLALSTINEILYRKCCPQGTEQVFMQLYNQTIDLLKELTNSTMYQLEDIDPLFIQKLSELLELLIQQHFWKFEIYSDVSSLDFLSLMFQLTELLPLAQCYYQCLTPWSAFVKQIKQQNRHKYLDVLQGLLGMLLRKFQYSMNSEQLKGINHNYENEDNETEWGLFVKSSNEIIASISEFAPVDTFSQVLQLWNTHHNNYLEVMKEISCHSDLANLMMNNVAERDRLCCLLTDMSTLTQTVARLSYLFTTEREDIPKSMDAVVEDHLRKLLECVTKTNIMHLLTMNAGQKVDDCLIMVYSELLASLRTWIFWMVQTYNLEKDCVNVLMEISLTILVRKETIPEKVGYSAACLLYTLSDQVMPLLMLQFKPIIQFMDNASIVRHPSLNIRQLIDDSVFNILLRDCNKKEDNFMDFRTYRVRRYMENLTSELLHLTKTTDEEKVRIVTTSALKSISHIIDYCRKFPNNVKRGIFTSIETVIPKLIELLPVYMNYQDVNQDLLSFFVTVFDVLKQPMGLKMMKEIVTHFVSLVPVISNKTYVEKLLQMMQHLVEAPCAKTLTPVVVELCMRNLCPIVLSNSKEHPEVYLAMLQVMHRLLLEQWRFFHQPDGIELMGKPEKPQELIAILEMFGQALMQEDINVCKFSIEALENLDRKRKIYTRDIFRQHLLIKFLTVLMGALLNQSYDLLSEEVQTAIYHMAHYNSQTFFETFLPQFIGSFEGITEVDRGELLNNFQKKEDMPSFINQLKMFISRAQKMCNS